MTTPAIGRGPVEFMLVAFPGSKFKGDIVPALKELVDDGTVRIIDLIFVEKTVDGDVNAIEISEFEGEEAAAFEELDGEVSGLLSDEDLALAADSLAPGDSAALLVWEDLWASRLADALRDAEARVLMIERIPSEVVEASFQAIETGG